VGIEKNIETTVHGGFKSFLKKAWALGVDIKFFPGETSFIKLKHKRELVFCRRGIIPIQKRQGNFTKNKELTKTIFKEAGIRTPKGIVAQSYKEAVKLIKKERLSYPLIAKPIDGTRAKGVTWNICSSKELKRAINLIDKLKARSGRFLTATAFLIEEMYLGDEFRVLVFGRKVFSCVQKIPASVVGDGRLTIAELVREFNKKRMKGFEIKIDKVVKNTLLKNKLTLQSVLPKNYNLKLRYNLNMSDGGRAVECTKKMSSFLKKVCIKATEAVGLTLGGIDLMTKNISSAREPYVILEINPNPYYNMHEKPLVEGNGIDFSKIILKHFFPKLK
jgi:cyanophycin synthetase